MVVSKIYSVSQMEVEQKINEIIDNLNSGGGAASIDQTYNANSANAQSGTAVAQAIATKTLVTFRDWSVA